MNFDLKSLQLVDRDCKPSYADDTWCSLQRYYDDASRDLTLKMLHRLGLGMAEQVNPPERSLLRYVAQRLAVVYSDPPSRWLVQDTTRLGEATPQHRLLQRVYQRAQIDVALREANALQSLHGQCAVRVYPLDSRGSVALRLFAPHNIMRDPDPGSADQISEDRRFALRLTNNVHECWSREGAGWRCVWTNDVGQALPAAEQPFGASGFVPYDRLPVVMAYDRFASGAAWVPPKETRIGRIETINAISADLLNLVALQGHGLLVFKRNNPNTHIPSTAGGPNTVLEIGDTDDVIAVNRQPQIQAVRDALSDYVRGFLADEGLNPDELEAGRAVYSGAQLKVSERALTERREAQIPLAHEFERVLFEAVRAVHNVHAAGWNLDPFDTNVEVQCEFATTDTPTDAKELVETSAVMMSLGIASTIDVIQRLHSCGRDAAIEIHERIAKDAEDYPAHAAAPTDPLAAVDATQAPTHDSMIDAATGVTAADARESRRDPAPAPALGAPIEVAKQAMNGAQVEAAKSVVLSVAAGEIPRGTGVEMLIQFFTLAPNEADRLMGEVGRGFTPRQPPANERPQDPAPNPPF